MEESMAEQVRIYGADWCGDTRRALRVLDTAGVQYDYIDIDDDRDGEKKVIEFNKGKRRIPLVEIASETGTQALSVPSDSDLKKALG
jgi:mycoredoxin